MAIPRDTGSTDKKPGGVKDSALHICPACQGRGKKLGTTCPTCSGSGKTSKTTVA